MHTPDFWWSPRQNLVSRLLAPAGWIYGAATARRMRAPGATLAVPVICVGNLVAGGAGKTPTALALGRMLRAAGQRPAFLSRGYGRTRHKADAVLLVDLNRHGAGQTGDEPLLLAAVAPTYVAADRSVAARCAIADGATVLILDDGLQNPTLRKTLSIAVVDGATGIGNGRCVPAGPLRAPLVDQWPHVSVLCVIGAGAAGEHVSSAARQAGVPIWSGQLRPDTSIIDAMRGIPLFAFAGIGHPAKFFTTLRSSGLAVVGVRAFADHHHFTEADLDALRQAADRLGARLVTTEKDRVRLPHDFPVQALPVSLIFGDPDEIQARVTAAIHADNTESLVH